MVQAGLGSGYAQQIISTEIRDFLSHAEGVPLSTVNLDVRIAFNPNLTTAWFTSVMAIINNISMLAIILAGAAVVREREHGTMDHLLVMPLTPFEIAMSKVWANGLVIAVAVGLSLYLVLRMILGIPVAGSIPLFMVGVVIYLFFATAIGIFLGTVARSMPQLGLLYMLVYLADEHALGQQYAAREHAALARQSSCRPRRRRISSPSRSRSSIAVRGWTWYGRNSSRSPSSAPCSSGLPSCDFAPPSHRRHRRAVRRARRLRSSIGNDPFDNRWPMLLQGARAHEQDDVPDRYVRSSCCAA